MTSALLEWFRGRNREDRGSYDFTESHPVWKTWWFWGVIVAACIFIVWFFRAA
jgi:hypothetical protein